MISPDLLAILRCPMNPSRTRLVQQEDRLVCERCALKFPIKDGFLTQSPDGAPIAPLMGDYKEYDGGLTSMRLYPMNYAYGLPDHGVTSLTRLLGRDVPVDEVAPLAIRHVADVFDLTFAVAPDEAVRGFDAAAVA